MLAAFQRILLPIARLPDLAVLPSKLGEATMEQSDNLLDLGIDASLVGTSDDPNGINLLALEQRFPSQRIRTIPKISESSDSVLLLTLTKDFSIESFLVDAQGFETFGGKGNVDGGHLHVSTMVLALEILGVVPLRLSFSGRSDEVAGIIGQNLEKAVLVGDADEQEAFDLLEKPDDNVALDLFGVESGHSLGRVVICDASLGPKW